MKKAFVAPSLLTISLEAHSQKHEIANSIVSYQIADGEYCSVNIHWYDDNIHTYSAKN